MWSVGGLAVFVRAKKSEVEIVALECRECGIAAESRGSDFRSKHQPQVGESLVVVEIVTLAGIEPHDRAVVACFIRTSFLYARDRRVALFQRLGGLCSLANPLLHLFCDVF